MFYLDTSAVAKLVLDEHESDALRSYLGEASVFASSALAVTELIRTIRRRRPALEFQARGVLDGMLLVDVERSLLESASTIAPAEVRSLDAIHLVSALTLGGELEALLTYDTRMAEAARSVGLRVEAPA